MNGQTRKDVTIKFLERHLKGVEQLLRKEENSFCFMTFVSGYNISSRGNICGTCCCMEGWLPIVFPELFRWKKNVINKFVVVQSKYKMFELDCKDIWLITFTYSLFWKAITVGGNQYLINCKNIPSNASFEAVSALWKEVIERIKRGEYDQYFANGYRTPNYF